ncbi:MAG: universal stress protein [Desulfarculaceae bacterium]|nr:universal stress protein [Desulfarculaceae bacterium]MCF8074465.1 universal stress protein [Desulfarculaceae bacterium]MCF8103693.1 universal stress protein [Desulfarculaceae bacterium]MCF8118135.1 universal stress protein [Desulfarculaceae bacterium]
MQDCKVDYRLVAAAVDFSDYSEITFAHAVEQARSHNSELLILNVINDRGLDELDRLSAQGYDLGGGKAGYIKRVEADRRDMLAKDYLPAVQDLKVRALFRVGHPQDELLKMLKEEGVSLLVMGTKGRSNLAGALFGSTAEKVFRHAPCPVLSVRGPEHCRL